MTIKAASSQDMRGAVMSAANFLIAKGHRDTQSFAAPQVVDLLCEYAAAQRKGLVEALQKIAVLDVGVGGFKVSPKVKKAAEIARAALHPEGKSETSENTAPYDIPESQVW